MKTIGFIGLFFLVFACFSGCQQEKSPEKSHSLRLNFSSEPTTLDHRTINYTNSANILPMLYDGLMRFDASGQLVPSVAKEVKVSADGKRYIFTLQRTQWSNGDPVTAYDFEYAWKWVLNPKNPAPLASHLYCLKNGRAAKEGRLPLSQVGVTTLDSSTLVVDLEDPLPYFLELITLYNFFPINRLRDGHTKDIITNGPFLLKEWDPQKEMILEKNPGYWDASHVALQEVHISFVQDANTELQLFQKGKLDWAGAPLSTGLPYNTLSQLNALETHPFLGTYYYTLNTKRPPFNNPKVRRALSQAILREQIVEHMTQGGETPAYRFVPPGANFITDNPQYTTNQIKELFNEGLSELNISREKLRPIVLSYNKSDMHHALAQAVQHRWKNVLGIDVQLKHRDWKAHLSEISIGNFDVARLSWKGITSDPIHFLEIFQDPLHPMHRTGWKSARYNQFIGRAIKSHQLDERLFLLAAAEEILTDEMPVIPVFHLTICYVRNPRLKGYVINQLGSIDYKWAYFSDGQISH